MTTPPCLSLPPHSFLYLSRSCFGLYSINTSYTLSLLTSLSLPDIQTQEPDRISLVPLDLVVLLLSLPEEDRD